LARRSSACALVARQETQPTPALAAAVNLSVEVA
jgi:hypothetical protein